MNSQGIEAAIDDGILNVPFQVKSFRAVFFDSMGNAIPEVSNGDRFSDRQKEQIRRLSRGTTSTSRRAGSRAGRHGTGDRRDGGKGTVNHSNKTVCKQKYD